MNKKIKAISFYPNFLTLIFLISTLLLSCKKNEEKQIEELEEPTNISYEVDCNYCDISYVNSANESKTIKSNVGVWTYKINTKINFELKVSVKTTLSSAQTINAYILKNDEIVYGNVGFNLANVTYNPVSGNGTSSFGSYVSTGSGSGGNTAPSSSVCGAKNKSGGYCKRIVVGGGRCWQHK